MKNYMLTTRSVKKRGSIRILHRNKKSGGGGEKEKSGVAKRGDDELFLRAHEKKTTPLVRQPLLSRLYNL